MGGPADDQARAIARDSAGALYIVGGSQSPGWVSGGPVETTYNPPSGAFLVKLSSAGEHEWSAFLGGGVADYASAVALDESTGAIYVGGTTHSSGWVVGGWDTTFGSGGEPDGFVVKFSADGARQWSTYVGGGGRDDVRALAVLPDGDLVVGGHTSGVTTWVSGGFSTSYRRHGRSYLARLTAAGEHVWSTHLGQSDSMLFGYEEAANGIAVDSQGNIIVVGLTASLDVARDGAITTSQGGDDAFVVKVSGAGALVWSTYLGGAGRDGALSVDTDEADRIFVAGHTASTGWVAGPGRTSLAGQDDGFLARLSAQGQIDWSRYLGGAGAGSGEGAVALAVSGDHLMVAGRTVSDEWISGAFAAVLTGAADSFLGRVDLDGRLEWVTLLGGPSLGTEDSLLAKGLVSDGSGGAHVVGGIDVAGWAGDGPKTSFGGGTDGFVAHVLGVLPTSQTGSLHVTIDPSAARDAGAAWRLLHHDAWRASGETIAGLAPGYYIVEYKVVGGWKAPTPRRVVIASNEQTTVQAVYETLALDWSSYLGAGGVDDARGVAVDSSGNTYVVGSTLSSGWVSGGFDTTRSQRDGYVVKLSPLGAHVWSGYLGGASYDEARAVAVDPATGALYVAGMTASPGWVSGGWNTTHNAGVSGSGAEDGFVVKLSPTGAHLWSTYLGGNSMDSANAIAVGEDGAVYVAGAGSPGNWGAPTSGSGRIFVARLDASGRHHWTTFFGGAQAPSTDAANGLAVDASGALYATGTTGASGWTSGGYLTTRPSAQAGFLIRLNVGTGAPDWSTYIGSWVAKNGVAVGPDGAPHVIGTAIAGTAWPGKSNGADKTNSESVQVVKFSPDGTPQWGRLLGDTSLLNDRGLGIAVNDTGAVTIVGSGASASLATPEVGSVHRGGQDAFVAKLSHKGSLLWWTWGGGPGEDVARAVTLGANGALHVVGETTSPDWMFGGWDVTYGGAGDGFVLKMRDAVGESASVRVTIDPAAAVAAGARWRLATDGIWRISGERIDGIVPGPHRIEFDAVAGWIRPVAVEKDLDHGEAFDIVVDYTPASGTVGHGWIIE